MLPAFSKHASAATVSSPYTTLASMRIYIDPTFFNELTRRFGAPGDFSMAYVIAHEVCHHVHDLQGGEAVDLRRGRVALLGESGVQRLLTRHAMLAESLSARPGCV